MAQAGFTPISLYFSSTAAAVPTSGNLANGELGLNIADMKLYAKNSAGTVTLLASNAGASGSVTSVSGTGTVNGLTLTGTVTTSGSLTLGGTLSLVSPPPIGSTTPNTGAFTTLSATKTTAGDAITFTNGGSTPVAGYLYSGSALSGLFAGANGGGAGYALSSTAATIYSPDQTKTAVLNNTGLAVTGALSATTTLGVTGATTLSSTLRVVNDVTIRDDTLNTPRVLTFSANATSAGNYGTIKFGNTQNLNNNASIVGSVDVNIDDGKLTFSTAPTGGSLTERFRMGSLGQFGIGGATYGTAGQVLTSGGASAAPTWAAAGGGSQAFIAFGSTGGL